MTSPPGARLPKEYMRFGHRNVNFKKCVVCEKALHSNNKSGLCSSDSHAEYVLNYKEQGFYKSQKKQEKSFYNCGHNRKHLFVDMEDTFVMINYFIWKDSEGFKGNRRKCFDCYLRDLKEEIKKKKRGFSKSQKKEKEKNK